MEEEEQKKENKPVTLPARSPANSILAIVKKIGLRTLAWVGVYLLGYFDFSIAWMVTPLVLSVVRDQWKKEKKNRLAAAREAALSNEQAMVEARLNTEELPSWVFFPDKERAEWVNNIIKQLWPYVNEYVRNTLFQTVEPAVEEALKGYKLSPFKFERDRVFLGQVPPRITGIKVYTNTNVSRKEIIMDVDIVYASDLEIVFKIKGISAKVSDFGLRGMARIVLKPLISEIPLIGGVQVYFLKPPEIDYNLGGVAGALEIPGLSRIVERIIIEQIKNFLVLPNKFSMPLVESIPNKVLKCPDSAGVLRVKMIQARDLVDLDGLGSGKSDPYVILTVGAHTFKLDTKLDTLNPVWEKNNVFDFPIEVVHGQELLMEFYDDDARQDDEFMGRAKIQTHIVAERGHIEARWIDLIDGESSQGQVQVSLSWLKVTADSAVVRKCENHDNAKGLVHLYIDSCQGLVNPRDPSYSPSPMVRIISPRHNDKSQQSWPKYNTQEPIIEQGFVNIITRPFSDELRIDVLDSGGKKDKVLGSCTINIWRDLVEQPGMEQPLRPWILKGNLPNAKIVMSASLRGLLPVVSSPRKNEGAASPTAGPDARKNSLVDNMAEAEPVTAGLVRLTVHRAERLEKKDLTGKSDPYLVVSYNQGRVGETKVCKKSLEPVWEEEFSLHISEGGPEMIELELFDKDKVGKDETMGFLAIDVRRIKSQGRLSQTWSKLQNCKSGHLLWSAQWGPQSIPDITTEPGQQISGPGEEEAALVADPLPEPEPSQPVVPPENLNLTEDPGAVTAGFLKVTVHRAEDLIAKDLGGKSDPYVVIRYDGQKNKSKHVKNELNPEFEFTTGYVTEEDGPSELLIELKDHDIGKDESLGSCTFDLRRVMTAGNNFQEVWTDLVGVKKGKVLVSLNFTGSGYNDAPEENIETIMEERKTTSPDDSGLRQRNPAVNGRVRLNILYDTNKEELKLFLHEAQNLPGGDLPDPPDPQVKVYLMPGKRKKKKSNVVKDSVDPTFNEEFDFSIDFKDLPNHWLKLSVVDKKGVFSKSALLGSVDIQLDDPGLQTGVAGWFPLHHMEEDSD